MCVSFQAKKKGIFFLEVLAHLGRVMFCRARVCLPCLGDTEMNVCCCPLPVERALRVLVIGALWLASKWFL